MTSRVFLCPDPTGSDCRKNLPPSSEFTEKFTLSMGFYSRFPTRCGVKKVGPQIASRGVNRAETGENPVRTNDFPKNDP